MENKVCKNKFLIYENIRIGGKTNMLDITKVISLSYGELNKKEVIFIMKNYSKLKLKYLGEE